ncbi:hypothetical protein EXIGLDRAFT_843758 [Exidia glandulosa HHB12029]|uniref:Uncharacterized protein n=1 Tax=Exidia glandulosa HHB12029 TaxID=1314781 RepID=A0A165CGG4_EXIGL|nr:hypothetical protein EXIGLDRAFT_843758 [Exidia glandulosa HHB12029]
MSLSTDVPRVDFDRQHEIPNRFSALLQAAAGGHALFEPADQQDEGGSIGDGGYINKGAFYRLFNAFTSPPAGIPSVSWNEDHDVSTRMRDNSSILKSSSASTVQFRASLGVESSLLPLLGVPPVSIEPVVRLEEANFAFLALAGREREVRVLKEPRRSKLKEWLAKHYEELYASYSVDIVIICETVRSSGWVGGLAYHDTREVFADIRVALPGVVDLGVGFTRGRDVQVDLVSTRGPNPNTWTVDLPPVYTVIVGLVVARRQILARIRRRILALRSRQSPRGVHPPEGPYSSVTRNASGRVQESAASNDLSAVSPSSMTTAELDPSGMNSSLAVNDPKGEVSPTSSLSSSLSLPDVGDETLLHDILDKALAEHEDADLAVGDWSLVTGVLKEHQNGLIRYDVEWYHQPSGVVSASIPPSSADLKPESVTELARKARLIDSSDRSNADELELYPRPAQSWEEQGYITLQDETGNRIGSKDGKTKVYPAKLAHLIRATAKEGLTTMYPSKLPALRLDSSPPLPEYTPRSPLPPQRATATIQNHPRRGQHGYVFAVVGSPGCGKSTFIGTGLCSWGHTASRSAGGIDSEIISHLAQIPLSISPKTTPESGFSSSSSSSPQSFVQLKVLEVDTLADTALPDAPALDGVLVCYDASRTASFAPVPQLLRGYHHDARGLRIVLIACKSDVEPKAVAPQQASDVAAPYEIGLVEISSETEVGRRKMQDCFTWLIGAVSRPRQAPTEETSPRF